MGLLTGSPVRVTGSCNLMSADELATFTTYLPGATPAYYGQSRTQSYYNLTAGLPKRLPGKGQNYVNGSIKDLNEAFLAKSEYLDAFSHLSYRNVERKWLKTSCPYILFVNKSTNPIKVDASFYASTLFLIILRISSTPFFICVSDAYSYSP